MTRAFDQGPLIPIYKIERRQVLLNVLWAVLFQAGLFTALVLLFCL